MQKLESQVSKLAVIATLYGRHENTLPLLHRLWVDGTRKPDETFLMCETMEDVAAVTNATDLLRNEFELFETPPGLVKMYLWPTPMDGGKYQVIPYSNKINKALDETTCDLIVYLDNGSMPSSDKFEIMAGALEEHPEWGAVYCTQKRTGMHEMIAPADVPCEDGYCALNYTQVMHRKTEDRWTLDMAHANPDLADGLFWRSLHQTLGVFFPVGGESNVLDTHHIPNPAAVGC